MENVVFLEGLSERSLKILKEALTLVQIEDDGCLYWMFCLIIKLLVCSRSKRLRVGLSMVLIKPLLQLCAQALAKVTFLLAFVSY